MNLDFVRDGDMGMQEEKKEGEHLLPITAVPQFDMVVKPGRSDISHVRREGDMIHLLLVTEQPSNGLVRGGRVPQVHGEVITGRH